MRDEALTDDRDREPIWTPVVDITAADEVADAVTAAERECQVHEMVNAIGVTGDTGMLSEDVDVDALAPAVVWTSLVAAALPDETVGYMTERIPMGRCGDLDEATELAAWIVSPACSFTTGFTFDLSGERATY